MILLIVLLPNGILSLRLPRNAGAERWRRSSQVQDLTKRFGGLAAVNDVSFDVQPSEILSVIGPNGAGKSTMFKLISSFVPPTSGEVKFNGEVISGLAPHMAARKGVVRTFQETTIFKGMSARDNVIIAHHLRSRASLSGFYLGSTGAARRKEFARSAEQIVDFLGLGAIKHERASNLPQGHLRALGIAIGLGANPKVLLLDEPFAGMNARRDATPSRWCAACASAASRSCSSSTTCRR